MLTTRDGVRPLGVADLEEFLALAGRHPVVNVFADYRARTTSLEPRWLGGEVWGRFESGRLVAACHVGANLVPVEARPEDARAFAERALSRGGADRMGLQRYDVLTEPGGFVEKSWLPVNLPIRDPDGRTVGILHHVEDVTHLLAPTALESDLLAPPAHADSLPLAGTPDWVQALRRDALERRTRANMLLKDSHHALERVSRRLDVGPA